MTNFWNQDADDRWMVTFLDADVSSLTDSEPWLRAGREELRTDLLWLRIWAGRAERWLLVAGQQRNVFVNGVPLELGLHELRDRDEILIAGHMGAPADRPLRRLYFSSERLARVEPLPVDIEEAVAATIGRLSSMLTWFNVHAYLQDLPQDLDVVAVEPTTRRVSRPFRFVNAN